MANVIYEKDVTALLVVDPYNDFISEGGKVWDRIRAVAEANNCVPHMLEVLNAARQASLRVFYALHHRYRPGDYETWKYIAPISKGSVAAKDLRIRHVGWRDPLGIRAAPGRDRRHGTLVFQWLRQHRFRFAAQEARHSSDYCHRSHSAYVHRSDRSFCRGAWVRCHDGERRDSGLFRQRNACRSRHQYAELCQCCDNKGSRRRDFISVIVGRISRRRNPPFRRCGTKRRNTLRYSALRASDCGHACHVVVKAKDHIFHPYQKR
jgi:hypothetical protein